MKTTYGKTGEGIELKTQWETIAYYLKEDTTRTITSGVAWNEFGFSRLSDIIYKIQKHMGVAIPRRTIEVTNRYGGKCNVTEYWWPRK